MSARDAPVGRSGADGVPGRPAWGVVMETGAAEGVTTLVATDDGSVSLLHERRRPHHPPHDERLAPSTGARFIGTAGDFLFECAPAWAHPLPDVGMIRFYLLTFDGIMTAEAFER